MVRFLYDFVLPAYLNCIGARSYMRFKFLVLNQICVSIAQIDVLDSSLLTFQAEISI